MGKDAEIQVLIDEGRKAYCLMRRWNLYRKTDPYAETIRKTINERHDLREVTLSKTGRDNNQGKVWLEKDVRKSLLKKANKLGLEPADYLRGIIYIVNQKLAHEEISQNVNAKISLGMITERYQYNLYWIKNYERSYICVSIKR